MKHRITVAAQLAFLLLGSTGHAELYNPGVVGLADINNNGALVLPVGEFTFETGVYPGYCGHPFIYLANLGLPAYVTATYGSPIFLQLLDVVPTTRLQIVQCGPSRVIDLTCAPDPNGADTIVCTDDGSSEVNRIACAGGVRSAPSSCTVYFEGESNAHRRLVFGQPAPGNALKLTESREGTLVASFAYAPSPTGEPLLSSVVDAFGNAETLVPDATGLNLASIVAPDGVIQTPTVSNPAGDVALSLGGAGGRLLWTVTFPPQPGGAVTAQDGYLGEGLSISLDGAGAVAGWVPVFDVAPAGPRVTVTHVPAPAGAPPGQDTWLFADPIVTTTFTDFFAIGRARDAGTIQSSDGESVTTVPFAGSGCLGTTTYTDAGGNAHVTSVGAYDTSTGVPRCTRPLQIFGNNNAMVAGISYGTNGVATTVTDPLTGTTLQRNVLADGTVDNETLVLPNGVASTTNLTTDSRTGEVTGATTTETVAVTLMYGSDGTLLQKNDNGLVTGIQPNGAPGYAGTPGTVTLPDNTQITLNHAGPFHSVAVRALYDAPYTAQTISSANGDLTRNDSDSVGSCNYTFDPTQRTSQCQSGGISTVDAESPGPSGVTESFAVGGQTVDNTAYGFVQ